MKAKILFITLGLFCGLYSCTKIEQVALPNPDPEPTLAEIAKKYADEHPPIIAPAVVPLPPKSAKLELFGNTFRNYYFKYDSSESLTNISEDKKSIIDFTVNKNTRKATSSFDFNVFDYDLNKEGFADRAQGLYNNGKEISNQYFYKNGYLVSMSNKLYITRLKYSPNGNLLTWVGLNHQDIPVEASYEYTDFPNAIRQEITRWDIPHFSLRSDFLGKYSTNLLQKVVIKNNLGKDTYIFDFTYTFDNQGRVATMTIKRNIGPDVIYQYSY